MRRRIEAIFTDVQYHPGYTALCDTMAPNPEVIQEWADYVPAPGTSSGARPYTFERGRMEKAIHSVCVEMPEENRKKQAVSSGATAVAAKKVKKDDVDFLVSL